MIVRSYQQIEKENGELDTGKLIEQCYRYISE